MVSERLRIRSDEELKQQNRGLVELSELLEQADVPHYLSSGTLLGAVREKNFIRWDWDVQFYFKLEDVAERFDDLMATFQTAGFQPTKTDSTRKKWKILVTKYDTIYEMTAWARAGDHRIRSDWKLPAEFFEDPDRIDFLGRSYICMTPPEAYLVYCYGDDWRTPKRIDDKDEYLAATYYQKSVFRRAIERKIHGWLSMAKRKVLAIVNAGGSRLKEGEHET